MYISVGIFSNRSYRYRASPKKVSWKGICSSWKSKQCTPGRSSIIFIISEAETHVCPEQLDAL